jgi:nitroreductase
MEKMPMDVSQALRARRSVRAFTAQVPSTSLVQQLLQDAALAASGGNLQPWRVVAITGQPLADLLAQVRAQSQSAPQEDVASYPPSLWEPYRTRRFVNGEELYRCIGIPREDKAGRLQQLAKNAQLFGAPVGVFVFIDARMGQPQWLDVGIYLQSLMLRAAEEGLATCAQGFWRRYTPLLRAQLQIPEPYTLACAVALGYEDVQAPINALRTERAEFAEWGQLQGF